MQFQPAVGQRFEEREAEPTFGLGVGGGVSEGKRS